MFSATQTIKVHKYLVDIISDDIYIANNLRHGYEWDGWMRSDLPNIYKPGTDIIDIGGNIGYNTLMFSDYGPVHTFEPVFNSIIEKNVSQNNLNNPVKVYPFGLGNTTEEILIYKPDPQEYGLINYGGYSMIHQDRKDQGVLVKIDRLDDVYSGIPSIIKIDVEMYEYQVLLGAEKTIRKYKPSMYIEIFDFETSPIIPFLTEMGYTTQPRPEHNYLFTIKDTVNNS